MCALPGWKWVFLFLRKYWRYLIFLLYEGSRPCKFLRFMAWKSWNVVTRVGCRSHLFGSVFWGCLRQTPHNNERRERSPLSACWHWTATETVVSEIPVLTCSSKWLSIQILIIHLSSAGLWPKSAVTVVWPKDPGFPFKVGRKNGRLLLEIFPI